MNDDCLAEWKVLVESNDVCAALVGHFQFLVETDECRRILEAFLGPVISARVVTSGDGLRTHLSITLPYMEDGEILEDEEPVDLMCFAPFAGDSIAAGVPESYSRVARVHNYIEMKNRAYDIPFAFWGLEPDGCIRDANLFDDVFPRGGQDREFVQKLEEQGLSLANVKVPFGNYQDWILYNPLVRTGKGEPALCKISHADGKVDQPVSMDLGAGPVLLRFLAKDRIPGHSSLGI